MREFFNLLCEFGLYTTGGAPYKKHVVCKENYRKESYKTETGEFSSIILQDEIYYNDDLKNDLKGAIADSIKTFFKKHKIGRHGLILVVGIGNEGMTADKLGSETLKYLKVSEYLYREGLQENGMGRLAGIKGSVSGITGLPSYEVVKGVVERIRPCAVIVVDTLSCKKVSRLQSVIQISDIGLTPGSGVGNGKTELNKNTLGVPVISIGVPLVIYAKNIISDYLADGTLKADSSGISKISAELNDLLVTVKEIDVAVEEYAKIIGAGINFAVHKKYYNVQT